MSNSSLDKFISQKLNMNIPARKEYLQSKGWKQDPDRLMMFRKGSMCMGLDRAVRIQAKRDWETTGKAGA